MISPARSGAMRSIFSLAARRNAISSGATPTGARALARDRRRDAAGMDDRDADARCRRARGASAFEKPRTANLLAEYALWPGGETRP
jgi:hypothetical protein